MAQGKRKDAWNHTSHLLAMLVNANPFRSGSAVHPSDFNPFAVKKGRDTIKVDFKMFLKALAGNAAAKVKLD